MYLKNYEVKAKVRWVETGTTASYPKYGISPAYKDSNNIVSVWLDKNNSVLATNAVIGGINQGWQNSSLSGFDFSVYHELKVIKSGTSFEFYLDGILQQTRTFDITNGQIGLLTEDTEADFDNVTLTVQ